MHAQLHGLARHLLAVKSLDVYHILLAVDGNDFAFTAFLRASDDGDLVVLADRDGVAL